MVGPNGLEPSTSRLSGVRSNHLSYGPIYLSTFKTKKKQYIEKYIEQGKTSIRKYSTSLKQKQLKPKENS